MGNYVKLICIDCHLEQIVEIPPEGTLTCPKCGHFAQIPDQHPKLNVAVESVIGFYGKSILDDTRKFCQLLEETLERSGCYIYLHEAPWFEDLKINPHKYAHLSSATQKDYNGYENHLMEAIYEAIGIETVNKKHRGLAYVPPTPPLPINAKEVSLDGCTIDSTKPKRKTKTVKPPAPKPALATKPTPVPSPTPVAQSKFPQMQRFVLPKARSATANCVVNATISGWEKGKYVVRFRTGYPCLEGENPKDAVLEICRWESSSSKTLKTAHPSTTRRISASLKTFGASSLMVEFSDGTPSFLADVPRSERKELEQILEIARYNNRT